MSGKWPFSYLIYFRREIFISIAAAKLPIVISAWPFMTSFDNVTESWEPLVGDEEGIFVVLIESLLMWKFILIFIFLLVVGIFVFYLFAAGIDNSNFGIIIDVLVRSDRKH